MIFASRHPRTRPELLRLRLTLFLGLILLFAGVTAWILANHYVSDFTLHRFSKVIGVVDGGDLRIEHFSMLYPHVPIYILSILYILPGQDSLYASHFLSALCIATMLAMWEMHLRRKGYRLRERLLLVALLASHPFVLWGASSGLHNALLLLGFYLFCYACSLVVHVQDVRAMAFLAMMLAMFYFVDERAVFIFLALLPLLPLLANRRLVSESMTGVYGVAIFPLLLALCTWMYLNWIFHGDPFTYLNEPGSGFRGAWENAQDSSWLRSWGGEWAGPSGHAMVNGLLAFPAIVWLCWRWRRRMYLVAACLVLFLHPIFAVGLATSGFFLGHPLSILLLLAGAVMGILLILPRIRNGGMSVLAALLLAGSLNGWGMIWQDPDSEVGRWRESLAGLTAEVPFRDERELGYWLKTHDYETLIDDRVFYRAIAARGHGHRLILSYSLRFKNQMQMRQPDADQVVVANPHTHEGRQGSISQQFPTLYDEGWPGYRLVYDHPRWRVWRREAAERKG